MQQIQKFINSYRNSNTYILYDHSDIAIMIDAGGPEVEVVNEWLAGNNKKLGAILLTHEHADHCLGVSQFYHQYKCAVYCTSECAANIGISKQNMSFYIEEISTFEVDIPVENIQHGTLIRQGELELKAIPTPGHSPGGCCFYNQLFIFTGDTILNGMKTPVTFPHSDRSQYKASIKRLRSLLQPGMRICPGHGDIFTYYDSKQLIV